MGRPPRNSAIPRSAATAPETASEGKSPESSDILPENPSFAPQRTSSYIRVRRAKNQP
jgi:hypothetical protein